MRKVRCVKNSFNSKSRKEPHEIDERFCNPRTKPETSRTCKGYCNSVYKWEVGIWQPVSNVLFYNFICIDAGIVYSFQCFVQACF